MRDHVVALGGVPNEIEQLVAGARDQVVTAAHQRVKLAPAQMDPRVVRLGVEPPLLGGREERPARQTLGHLQPEQRSQGRQHVDQSHRAGHAAAGAPYGRRGMEQLLSLSRVQDPAPTSPGALDAGAPGPPQRLERRTSDFGRADYVLPSRGLAVVDSGVFWPAPGDPLRALVDEPQVASDHRLVWVDVDVPAAPRPAAAR